MEFRVKDLERNSSSRIDISGLVDSFQEMVPNNRFTDLRDVYVEGTGFFNSENDEFFVNCTIEATVEIPCAISLKPVEIEIEATLSEIFLFGIEVRDEEDDDNPVIVVDTDVLDLDPYIWDAILVEIPLKVVHPDLKEYPSGNGWVVLKEEDYLEQKSKEIDPRLAKLKDFKFD
ncbi:hypothetical protein AOC36_05745 [Erysipelothrix larvae]|uniref:DUF177 domain-containing protein n=1 Tax=Erysipelothrix larvae TaxID=1514105 RepID=A0A0X8H007_9FIRM|nr:DUF177 domain-containing protein [Erysipelothrix larvae]AMC93499.1 hypothetical protein AOC36_05745 [Erysipelothrix larvae]